MRQCHYCPSEATTRDHIVPRALIKKLRLGDNNRFHQRNVVPACEPCNQQKADLDSGCKCPTCSEAWGLYEELCIKRKIQGERVLAYTTESAPLVDITDLFRRPANDDADAPPSCSE